MYFKIANNLKDHFAEQYTASVFHFSDPEIKRVWSINKMWAFKFYK